MKYLINILSVLLLNLILSCTTIASLTEEPIKPQTQTIKDLSIYEAKLSDYVMYLQVFLTRTKKKFPNDIDYPKFNYFDASLLKSQSTTDALLFNIGLLKEYIKITKPIAQSVYKKYSKLIN
ncbi:hypothetical protein F9Y90_05190 (plasmid) [Borrelia miyamotoi]|uniref:Outer surface protein n=1 Tax=Borrelia miyamotoi TaxID=47466 RepID=A0A5P8ARB0_9SPIR|nr:BBA14 family lipoprotein [Borrelia miyamotoi]QFP42499.1 hypothetical protein F9Y90_05190 [Borrelia miyamotoi]WAZ72542.1 hypothetical protein O5404_05710 [Borrelia miyamotoi]